jgi:hypothetical protein
MIFRRKRKAEDDTAEASVENATEDSAVAAEGDRGGESDPGGPYDVSEIDLEADLDEQSPRIDLGSLLITGFPGMELQLQVSEESQQVVAAVIVTPESALELVAFAAPRTGGLWAELQEEYVTATTEAGGQADLRDGPYGSELHRVVPVDMPDGRRGEQETRTWMAEGPRWMLRGILHGAAARVEGTDGPVTTLYEAFSTVVVRRGDEAMGPGDPLPLRLPEDLTPS